MYEPPQAVDPTPRAVVLFPVYAALAGLVYGAAGIVVLAARALPDAPGWQLALGLVALATVNVVAALAPKRPWSWTLANVALALGTASCLLPLALPLLVAWQKPLVKAAYGRL